MTSGFYSARNAYLGFPNLSSVISSGYLAVLQDRARNTFFVADAVLTHSLTFPHSRAMLGEEELKD